MIAGARDRDSGRSLRHPGRRSRALAREGDRALREPLLRGRPGSRSRTDRAGSRRAAPIGAPVPIAPPNPGPSAFAFGAGGASPAVSAPPVPGVLHRPPLAASPLPDEASLRTLPAMLSDGLGTTPSTARAIAAGAPGCGRLRIPAVLPLAGRAAERRRARRRACRANMPGADVASRAGPAGDARRASRSRARRRGGSALDVTAYEFRPEIVPNLDTRIAPVRSRTSSSATSRSCAERVHGRRARLARQRRDDAEAAGGHRSRSRTSTSTRTPTCTAPRTPWRRARPTPTRRRARRCERFSTRLRRRTIVFVRGATEGDQPRRAELGPAQRGAGDEIVITWLEHHANIVPWQQLCSREGRAPARRAGRRSRPGRSSRSTRSCSDRRTRIVSFTQVSNALGTIAPAQRDDRHGPPPRRASCWSTARRPSRTCRSTCRRSTATSTSSPATRSSRRRASARSSARRPSSTRCRRGRAAGT